MSINNATVCGYITRDCDKRSIGGASIISFTVAINEPYKEDDGWTTRPHYIPCVFFGSRAEKLAGWLVKGAKVIVSGQLRYSEWTKDEQKHSKVEINVKDIEFMTKDNKSENIPF